MNNLKRSLFIVFEGIDGSGKSTQASLISEYMKSKNIPSIEMAEPTDGRWGREIREILKGDIMPPADDILKLFLLDREDDVNNNIVPALKDSKSVIMDRYYYSNAAYQGAMGLSPGFILDENRRMKFPEPDRVYLIDVDPGESLQRISERNGKSGREIFEKLSFLKRVRDIFLSMADDKFLIIDGSKNVGDIFNIIKKDFEELLSG